MADHALCLRRAIDVALNCLAIDVGADRIPPQEEGGGGRGDGNENDCNDDDDDDDDDVVVPTMDETVVATGGKGRRKGRRGGEDDGRRAPVSRGGEMCQDVTRTDHPSASFGTRIPEDGGTNIAPRASARVDGGGVDVAGDDVGATRVGCRTRTGRVAADVRGRRGGRARTIESRTTAAGGGRRREGGERSASTTIRRAGRGVAGTTIASARSMPRCRTQPRRRRGLRGG